MGVDAESGAVVGDGACPAISHEPAIGDKPGASEAGSSSDAPEASRRRILVLAPFAPARGSMHGSATVLAELLPALAVDHAVALIYLRGDDDPAVDDELAGQLDLIHEVLRPEVIRGVRGTLSLLFDLIRLQPMWIHDWWSDEFATTAKAVVATWKPDVVQIEMSVMAPYVHALADYAPARLLTVYNPSVVAACDRLRNARWRRKAMHGLDVLAWRRAEGRAIRSADAVVVFTENDRAALVGRAGTVPISVVSLGVAMPPQPSNASGTDDATVLFVGGASHLPNTDAARRLCSELLPRLLTRVPDARLVIVGKHPPGSLACPAEDHLTLTGWVPDLEPYIDRANVVVAPLRLGGGMRVKVLEALARGKAVVGTSVALAGLPVADIGAAVCADDDNEFVDAVAELLLDETRRVEMAHRAREWAVVELAWSLAITRFDAVYDSIAQPAADVHRR